jgi:hypothetical protein
MIIKEMDSKQEEIGELTALLKGKPIPYQRFLIERELRAIPFLPERRSPKEDMEFRFISCYPIL